MENSRALCWENFYHIQLFLFYIKFVVASNKSVICKDSIVRYDDKSFKRNKNTSWNQLKIFIIPSEIPNQITYTKLIWIEAIPVG